MSEAAPSPLDLVALRKTWKGMISRCKTNNSAHAPRFALRGVTVCPEWANSFDAFAEWSLKNGWEPGARFQRVSFDASFTPVTCRWVSREIFSNSALYAQHARQCDQRKTVPAVITVFRETKAVEEWVLDPRCVVTAKLLRKRLRQGWAVEAALTTPDRWARSLSQLCPTGA